MRISGLLIYRGACRGFTLMEILVVMFIVTLLAGLTLTLLPGFARSADLDAEARRVELLLDMAGHEAALDSVELGFRLTQTGYEFLQYDHAAQTWQKAGSPFHERRLPEGLRFRLLGDDAAPLLQGEDLPPVLILSSGETTPFRLVMEAGDESETRTLTTNGWGEFFWQTSKFPGR